MSGSELVEGSVMANLHVQWKGTELCGDFTCECGADGHFDEMFVYSIRCRECNQVWIVPTNLSLVKAENSVDSQADFWGRPENAKVPQKDDPRVN